jgi:hypothetical protein
VRQSEPLGSGQLLRILAAMMRWQSVLKAGNDSSSAGVASALREAA